MQREGEPDGLLDLVHEAPQARQPADGRDRRPPVCDPEVRQAPSRREDVVEVQHRLAHPHEDTVVDGLDPPEMQRLVEDLGGGQVPAEAHRARRAERAGQRAARLRGDADRAAPVAIAHEHRLHGVAVLRAEERLDRAVARFGLCGRLEGRERHLLGQRDSQRKRDVAHLVVAGGAVRGPFPNLACPVARLPTLRQLSFEQLEIHWQTVAPE